MKLTSRVGSPIPMLVAPLVVSVLLLSACEEKMAHVDDFSAQMHGLCMGIAPGADVAAQRRWVLDMPGVFSDIMIKLSDRFPPPVTWSAPHQLIWKKAIREGLALGRDLTQNRIDSRHTVVLNRCRSFSNKI